MNPKVMERAQGDDLGGRWLATHTADSGPYRVERFVRGQQVVLRPNPHAARRPGGVRLVNGLSPTIAFPHMNNDRPLFKDLRVCRAVSMAVDRERIGRALYGGRTRLVRGVLPEGVPGHDPTLPLPVHDPAAARRLLRDAGVPPGTRLTFTVVGESGAVTSRAIATPSSTA